MRFAVCGLHMSNGPLNYQLSEGNGTLVEITKTVPDYTMYALSSPGTPTKPGMVHSPLGGTDCSAITVEIWDLPETEIGKLLVMVPAPLGFGTVLLQDGSKVKGFICEGWASDPAAATKMGITSLDITRFGGWREWRSSLQHDAL